MGSFFARAPKMESKNGARQGDCVKKRHISLNNKRIVEIQDVRLELSI